MTLIEAVIEESKAMRMRAQPLHDAVRERIASGGRKPSYAPKLSAPPPLGGWRFWHRGEWSGVVDG